MKKLISILLAVCMCLSSGIILTACNEDHIHSYKTEWSNDTTHHWHECIETDCIDVSDKAEHAYGNCTSVDNAKHKKTCECGAEITEDHLWDNGKITTEATKQADGVKTYTCTSCSQTKTENIGYVLTEADIWENAFDNSKITNCTVRLEDPKNGTITYKVALIDGERTVHLLAENLGADYYLVYTDDGRYVAYTKSGTMWQKQEFDEKISAFELCSSYSSVCPNFSASFSKFEFDATSGTYVFNGIEDSNEIETNDIMTLSTAKYYNAVVKIVDGKLVSIESNMSGQNGKTDKVYFENYGTTTIELPEVTSQTSEGWEDYFVFDNVTAAYTTSTCYDQDTEIESTTSIKVDGDEWLWIGEEYYQDIVYEELLVYCDGTNTYVNGVIDNDMSGKNSSFFFYADFSNYESSFTQTQEGRYEADEISIYGVLVYNDITIIVQNGNIVSINYSYDLSYEGTDMTITVSYAFSDWGETEIDGTKYTQPSVWNSYFELDNVTVIQTYSTTNGVTETTLPADCVWKYDGITWSCVKDMAWDNYYGVIDTDYVYYDGTTAYLNGEEVEKTDIDTYSMSYSIGFLKGYENSFTKTEQDNRIIYTANSVYYDTYVDVEIVVENGKIIEVTYTNLDGHDLGNGTYQDLIHHFEFSDYDTTVVSNPYPQS